MPRETVTTSRSHLLLDRRARFLISELQGGAPDDAFAPKSLAFFLDVSDQFLTIGRMKSRAYGPEFFKTGTGVFYRRDKVLAWLEARAAAYEARRKERPQPMRLITMV